jgi:hypothetical protein
LNFAWTEYERQEAKAKGSGQWADCTRQEADGRRQILKIENWKMKIETKRGSF